MIEVSIFTVVVAHPDAPSVVVLTQKGVTSSMLGFNRTARLDDLPFDADMPETAADFTAPTDSEEPLLLPIWIGYSEAEAIMHLLEQRYHSRPLTHDLLANVIGALGSKVERVVIDKVMGATFFASICLNRDGRTISIDARPSDSIALALQTGASIFVDEDVMNAAARQFRIKVSDAGELLYGSEDEMDRFHSFIESVNPEDFTV